MRMVPRFGGAPIWRGLIVSAFLAGGLFFIAGPITVTHLVAQQASVQIDANDIGGVVTGPKGPEAGVWVIAETTQLPTKFAKIVVTDDAGRYVIPDLPKANFNVWVRGYGLVDSKPVQGVPGKALNLTAVVAPSPREAAQYYPPSYWFALIEPPAKSEFPGTGPQGNGIAASNRTQAHWVSIMKQGCGLCHPLGTKFTRELGPAPTAPTQAASNQSSGAVGTAGAAPNPATIAAWDRRVQYSQRGAQMSQSMSQFGRQRGLAMFAAWTEAIAGGALPTEAPPRPQGIERNLVLTIRDWGLPTGYVHDEVTTDKRNPTVNANGPGYGVVISDDLLAVIDPVSNEMTNIKMPLRADPKTVPPMMPQSMPVPSPVYGSEILWTNPGQPHNPMMDAQGRVWATHTIRPNSPNPAWCQEGSSHPSAKRFPLEESGRNAAVYDPKTKQFTLIDTCFGTHHLQFAHDKDNTLYFSGDNNVVGWLNTRMFDETKNEQTSQGWCPLILDTNGDGKVGAYVNPDDPVDPTKDKRIPGGSYGIIVSPVDGSVWIAQPGPVPGRIIRLDPATCMAEAYDVPFNPEGTGKSGFTPRGLDIDKTGVLWTALSGSGHMASFDRKKCTVLNGPTATGKHCDAGWTLYKDPGPTMKNAPELSADHHYYNWVDQFNTLGLGENVPISTGNYSDSLLALDPKTGKWTILRVPYPMGFFSRGMDGRIDDPKAGWKGRGLWATNGGAVTWHIEGGKGTKPKMIHFQMRPDPLAH